MLKKRSGNTLPKVQLNVDFARSASMTMMFLFSVPTSSSAWPYASRVASPIGSAFAVVIDYSASCERATCSWSELGDLP